MLSMAVSTATELRSWDGNCTPTRPKCLSSGSLQKKVANPWPRRRECRPRPWHSYQDKDKDTEPGEVEGVGFAGRNGDREREEDRA